jgi:hypothetical protein
MLHDRIALTCLADWLDRVGQEHERLVRQRLGGEGSELFPRLYNAAEAGKRLLIALVRPPCCTMRQLDTELRRFCRELRVLLEAVPRSDDSVTLVLAEMAPHVAVSWEVAEILLDSVMLAVLAAVTNAPSYIAITLDLDAPEAVRLQIECDVPEFAQTESAQAHWVANTLAQIGGELTTTNVPFPRWLLQCGATASLPIHPPPLKVIHGH